MRGWLGRKAHGYYFVLVFCVGFILGIAASAYTSLIASSLIVIAVILMLVGISKFRRSGLMFVFVAALIFGCLRGQIEQKSLSGYEKFYNQSVLLQGEVVDDVTYSKNGGVSFKLNEVLLNNQKMGGEVWVKLSQIQNIKRSDTLVIRGTLLEGFGSFYASLVRGEVVKIYQTSDQDAGLVVRDKFASETDGLIPEPERSLGLGYLLGLKTALPEDLQRQIQLLGLTHVVVASGYNLTILVTFARRIFQKISKYLSAFTGGVMIVGFILITGFSPSMSRAGIVAGLSLLTWYYGRKIHPVTLLLIAMAITLFVRPSYIWGDIGWYLSFTAFFGILVLAPLLHDFFWGAGKKPSIFRDLVVATFSAQVMTMPIVIHAFGAYSIYSLLANMLVLPVVPLSMLATFLTGVAGFMGNFIGQIFAIPAIILLKYCTFVVDKLAGLPSSTSELSVGLSGVFIMYCAIGVIVAMLMFKTKHNFLKDKIIVD